VSGVDESERPAWISAFATLQKRSIMARSLGIASGALRFK
jgi:hypothetical protein